MARRFDEMIDDARTTRDAVRYPRIFMSVGSCVATKLRQARRKRVMRQLSVVKHRQSEMISVALPFSME
jgi:hypothetical protein